MVARSQSSRPGISVLIDPETILLPDIITILHYVHKLNRDWFLTSTSSSISHFPFILDDTGKYWLQKDGKRIGTKKVDKKTMYYITYIIVKMLTFLDNNMSF